ncbi:unnamed protein product [Knipowitschia caucasica]
MSGSSGEEYIPPAASSSRRSAPKRKRASTSQGRGGGWGQGPSHAGVAAVNLSDEDLARAQEQRTQRLIVEHDVEYIPPVATSSLSSSAPKRKRASTSQGRGRGRGQGPRHAGYAAVNLYEDDLARVQELITQRRNFERALIQNLSPEQCRDVLTKAVDGDPGVLFDIITNNAPPERNTSTENPPPWCRCAHCREMPTDVEKKCCLHPPELCISTVAHVETYIIQRGVLRLARRLWNEFRAMVDGSDPGEDNRQFRHAAYRQYVAWQHGRLGAGRRVVIPSCMVWRIRDTFPDPNGNYTGFIPRRL